DPQTIAWQSRGLDRRARRTVFAKRLRVHLIHLRELFHVEHEHAAAQHVLEIGTGGLQDRLHVPEALRGLLGHAAGHQHAGGRVGRALPRDEYEAFETHAGRIRPHGLGKICGVYGTMSGHTETDRERERAADEGSNNFGDVTQDRNIACGGATPSLHVAGIRRPPLRPSRARFPKRSQFRTFLSSAATRNIRARASVATCLTASDSPPADASIISGSARRTVECVASISSTVTLHGRRSPTVASAVSAACARGGLQAPRIT